MIMFLKSREVLGCNGITIVIDVDVDVNVE